MNLWKETGRLFDVMPGSQIGDTINEAIKLAIDSKMDVAFSFNGTLVLVNSESDQIEVYRKWSNDRGATSGSGL